jgi:hypothetical protein
MELLITEAACAQSAALHRATQNVMWLAEWRMGSVWLNFIRQSSQAECMDPLVLFVVWVTRMTHGTTSCHLDGHVTTGSCSAWWLELHCCCNNALRPIVTHFYRKLPSLYPAQ